MKKTIGGNRLGSGSKMTVNLHNYERSSHDLGYIWRSSMSAGTLVPFMQMIGLPGDTLDIELNTDVKTYPTIGPMFGSFKQQLDVFMIPMRLYNAAMHNNKLNVGLDMAKIMFPQVYMETKSIDLESPTPLEWQQVNQSSLLAYLGIRGIGKSSNGIIQKNFQWNAIISILGYL